MTTHPTQEDDMKTILDALAGVPRMAWTIHGHNVIIPETEEDNAQGLINFAAIFNKLVGKRFSRYVAACNPARIARLLAHIDAQAVRLEAAERDAERYQWTLHHLGLIEAHAAKWSPAKHRPLLFYIQDFIDTQRAAIASESNL